MPNEAANIRAKMQAEWPGASVHSRGKGWIKHQHPTDPDKFSYDTQVGAKYHKGSGPFAEADEVDTDWVASGGAWDYEVTANDFECYVRDSVPVSYLYLDTATQYEVEITFDQPQWVNDSGNRENLSIAFSQVTPTITENRLIWEDITSGWDVEVNAQSSRLQKLLTIASLASMGDAPTLSGTVYFALSLKFSKSSQLDIYVDGVLWNEKSNNPQETSGTVEFRDGANTLFSFPKPWAKDENTDGATVTQYLRQTGNQLWVEVRIPYTWLQSAVYPIVVDPTVDEQVGASADDAYERVSESNTILDDGFERVTSAEEPWVGARFQTVAIEGTIDVAHTSLRSYSATSEIDFTIYAEATADSTTFTTADDDITDRTKTTASVDWDELTGVADFMQSPSIVTVIQELIDSHSFVSGNDINLLYKVDNSGIADFYMYFWDGNTAYAPKLHVEYTAGGAAVAPTSVIYGPLVGPLGGPI